MLKRFGSFFAHKRKKKNKKKKKEKRRLIIRMQACHPPSLRRRRRMANRLFSASKDEGNIQFERFIAKNRWQITLKPAQSAR